MISNGLSLKVNDLLFNWKRPIVGSVFCIKAITRIILFSKLLLKECNWTPIKRQKIFFFSEHWSYMGQVFKWQPKSGCVLTLNSYVSEFRSLSNEWLTINVLLCDMFWNEFWSMALEWWIWFGSNELASGLNDYVFFCCFISSSTKPTVHPIKTNNVDVNKQNDKQQLCTFFGPFIEMSTGIPIFFFSFRCVETIH